MDFPYGFILICLLTSANLLRVTAGRLTTSELTLSHNLVDEILDDLINLDGLIDSVRKRNKRQSKIFTEDENELLKIMNDYVTYLKNNCYTTPYNCQSKNLAAYRSKINTIFQKIKSSGGISSGFMDTFKKIYIESKKAVNIALEAKAQTEICKENLCSTSEGCPLDKNTLLTTLPQLNKEFLVSFEFRATAWQGGVQNVIHFTEGGDCCNVGQRVPGLWVYNSGQLHPTFAVGDNSNYYTTTTKKYSLNTWHSVEFSQTLKNGKYMYKVVVDGEDVIAPVENTKPRTFSNVKVYAADNFYDPLKGSIKNLLINTDLSNGCGVDCQNSIGKGKDYTGSVSNTKSGKTCQKWSRQSPHKHQFSSLGDHNQCRNPDGEPGVWCYTTDPNTRWELCDVPLCTEDTTGCQITSVTQDGLKFSSPGYDGTGYKHSQEYCWLFKAENEEDKLSISIKTMDTEYGYDIITIYENTGSENKEQILLSTSGDTPPGNIISNKNKIKILFNTDITKNMKGFEASVVAIKKKDLPHFSWENFRDGKIGVLFQKESSNPINEVIEVELAKNFEKECIFHGSTKNTDLTISSPYSSSNCQSLGQQAQISISSVYLPEGSDGYVQRAQFAIKDGILQQITEEVFIDNTFQSLPILRSIQQQSPSYIEIKINLAYDRSILDKFKKYGSSDLEIKKQLQQMFYFAKRHLWELSRNTKINLILKRKIILIDETFQVNKQSLQHIRQFQTKKNEPLIVICPDIEELSQDIARDNFVKGLSFRSGACRTDGERYGVALVAWRENTVSTGETLAHEIEHMFGMTHHGHTHHDISNWYSKQGYNCYTEKCPSPPPRDNGEWSCTKNNKKCHLKCSPGFATITSNIQCENGQFSINVEKIVCSPTVFLITGGKSDNHHMEIYNPTDGTERKTHCSNLPYKAENAVENHVSVFYEGYLIFCGANELCASLDLEVKTSQWQLHPVPYIPTPSIVVSNNKLFLFSRYYRPLSYTTFPIQEIPKFTYDYNMKYRAEDKCVARIDDDNAAIMGGHNSDGRGYLSNVIKYNFKKRKTTDLAPMITPRMEHSCLKVDINGKPWLIIIGGRNRDSYYLKKTERLNLDGNNKWEAMNDINVGRRNSHIIWTRKDTIMVVGGIYIKSIEVLNWATKTWTLRKESLTKTYSQSSIAEIPALLLGCQINDVIACPTLPTRNHGKWICNTAQNECVMHCNVGYTSLFKRTICMGGLWTNVNKIECEPSVWLDIYGYGHNLYHPTIGKPTCSKTLPNTIFNWVLQTTSLYENYIYVCQDAVCNSINLEKEEFDKWERHDTNIQRTQHSSVVLKDKLYIIGGYRHSPISDQTPVSTTLPLTKDVNFIPIPNLTHIPKDGSDGQCTAKLNEHSFIIIWSDGRASTFDAEQQTDTELPRISPARGGQACVIVTESEKEWIVVSGGFIFDGRKTVSTTERLDLSNDAATWEKMGDLKSARYDHQMIMTERGVLALGGWKMYTVELLNWRTKQWSHTEPSLTRGSGWMYKAVEVPASTFDCQLMSITSVAGCQGEYDYNREYLGGNVKELEEGETCHSMCEKESDCKTWSWNPNNQECRLRTSLGTLRDKSGSIAGLQGTCKPKCYSLIEHLNASVSTQLCEDNIGSEQKCQSMIQMTPEELQEDNNIYICYTVESKSLCEEIEYEDVELLCNAEPSIVTLSTKKRINKHQFTKNLSPHFGKYG